eukprot:6460836-Amphidinium_carterae.1
MAGGALPVVYGKASITTRRRTIAIGGDDRLRSRPWGGYLSRHLWKQNELSHERFLVGPSTKRRFSNFS